MGILQPGIISRRNNFPQIRIHACRSPADLGYSLQVNFSPLNDHTLYKMSVNRRSISRTKPRNGIVAAIP
jgi:hypothetical protein